MNYQGTVILLGACGSAGINFARCVRHAGWRVIAADTNATKLTAYKDTEFDEIVLMPEGLDQAEFRGFVLTLLRQYDADAIHAQPDVLVKALVNILDIMPEMHKYIWKHSVAQLKVLEDKLMAQRALVKDKEFSENIFSGKNVGLFFGHNEKGWLRLREGAGSQAALPVTGEKQAKEWMKYWMIKNPRLKKGDFVITPILPGREFAVQALYLENGECLHMQARQRNEYVFANQMPSGQSSSPSVATITSEPEIYDQAREYLKTLQSQTSVLTGIYGVDMKEDENGKCIMTEINYGRFYTTSEFFARCGVNTPAVYLNILRHGYFYAPSKVNSVPFDHKWVRTLDAEPVFVSGGGDTDE